MNCFYNIPCDLITDLGCYPHCDIVELGDGLPNGNYTIKVEWNDTTVVLSTDETLSIDPTMLPMNQELLLTVLDFDGDPVLFDDNQYLKIKFKYTRNETIEIPS